jgi:hypothetical protein
MKLLNSLKSIISEAKSLEEIYNQYYSDIPLQIFTRIIKADPKTVVKNDKILKVGKYAKILLNIYKIGNMPNLENLVEATRYLKIVYDKNLSIDIKNIKQISDLYDIVKNYIVSIETPIKEILKELPKDSYKLLHNGENWVVFRPLTEKAAAWLGVGSSWCTTWGKYSLDPTYKSRSNLFTTYNYAPIYIMIDKSDEKHKYQFQFKKDEFRDVRDGMINVKGFFIKHEELREFYFPLLVNKEGIFSEEEQFDRINALSDKFASKLNEVRIERLVESGISNPIALAFAKNDTYAQLTEDDEEEGIIPLISDRNLDDITYEGSNIDFELRSPCSKVGNYSSIGNLKNHIDYIEGLKRDNNLSDDIYEERYDFGDIIKDYVDDYFEKNSLDIKYRNYNFPTLDRFKQYFLTIISNRNSSYFDKIFDKWSDKTYDATISSYNGAIENDLDSIKKYAFISESGYYSRTQTQVLSVNSYEFIQYVNRQRIDQITDICQLFEYYIDYADIVTDEWYVDYDRLYPSSEDMYPVIADVLEDVIIEEFGSVDDPNPETLKIRMKLVEIIEKYFYENKGYDWKYREYPNIFDGTLVKIYLNPQIDFDDSTVKIILIDKKTKNEYIGNMPIDELYNTMFNYKLDLFLNNTDVEES